MAPFADEFDGRPRVLEFGCGPGGNLLALRPRLSSGVGVDINPGYIRHARRLARRGSGPRLDFLAYDGRALPPIGPAVDRVFAFGVFERLPAAATERYVRDVVRLL